MPARGKHAGSFQNLLDIVSKIESASAMAEGGSAIMQCMWVIFECAP
jgi:hypothetical protein